MITTYCFTLKYGPKDGTIDSIDSTKELPPTLEYFTYPGRVAIYDRVKDGVYHFSHYILINN
jgi:hypothetical protein